MTNSDSRRLQGREAITGHLAKKNAGKVVWKCGKRPPFACSRKENRCQVLGSAEGRNTIHHRLTIRTAKFVPEADFLRRAAGEKLMPKEFKRVKKMRGH